MPLFDKVSTNAKMSRMPFTDVEALVVPKHLLMLAGSTIMLKRHFCTWLLNNGDYWDDEELLGWKRRRPRFGQREENEDEEIWRMEANKRAKWPPFFIL